MSCACRPQRGRTMDTLCGAELELAPHQAEEAPAQAIEPQPNLSAIGFAKVAPSNCDPERRMGLEERAPSGGLWLIQPTANRNRFLGRVQ